MTLTAASLAQIAAADPHKNTWLSANAGSGKTRVLTDRVARLLLGGVQPQHILCLTYTKAAASEMQNRLFKRLGAWAMKPDEDLRRDLLELGEAELSASRLSRARQLFARAIETPGGLRIQTIHSFCATLLRRFPLEAGVAPAFTEMDDRAARLLRAEIVEEMADGLAPALIKRLTQVYTSEDFGSLIEQVARERAQFSRPLNLDQALVLFGLPAGTGAADILSLAFLGGEAGWMPDVLGALESGSVTDVRAAARLRGLDFDQPDLRVLETLESILLLGENKVAEKSFTAKIDSFPTKDTRARLVELMPRLNDLMGRVETARRTRIALKAAEKSAALHAFAAVFLPLYEARKSARGLLDFDDLITRARGLLTDPSLAAWVLFRLDGGIDHILVDEAQDTSPDQWQVIESLAAELTSGLGAQTRPRTLFVVGDKKQSIYSFQGADVAAFDQKRDLFATRLAGGDNGLADLTLQHSFRSSPAILRLVDHTFTGPLQTALGGEASHIAFHETLAGRVDLWPPMDGAEKADTGEWFDPVDLPGTEHPAVQLARKIADEIHRMIADGVQIPLTQKDGGPVARPVHAGDFLILVQRRSLLFQEIIRACKARKLPIAGADRLKLGAELAVKDLAALLAFLDTPEDDLSLAAVLRSPLGGWTEAQLFSLSHGRKGYLWEALREHPDHIETRTFLQDLRDQADYLRPYDLIERALQRHDMRRKLLSRLGPEAEDGIDELLSQALAYERSEVPSLTGFLVWLETDDVEVKRQLDGEGHRIRVMTVHGAKGLEAPIVVLPDTVDRKPPDRDEIYRAPNGVALWKTPDAESPALVAAARQARRDRRGEESLRLLYVAMTRARCWLIVAAAGSLKTDTAWYTLLRGGAEAIGVAPLSDGTMRHAFGQWPENRPVRTTAPDVVALPVWAERAAPEPPKAAVVLTPSDLGGAKALVGEPLFSEDLAKARGTALHLLLERLPLIGQDGWPLRAQALIADPALCADLLAEATAVLSDPNLAPLFGRDTLAETTVTGAWNGQRIAGTIDRLVLVADRVLIIDYKSNALIPDAPEKVPEGILRQLGAYAHIIGQIYPDRRIETAVLWTRAPQLMRVDPDIVRSALARAAIA
ncbi:double-strand break repair helicase AddA [Tabrizicola sp.]|uniref:double-strand break repair helicase AddA n=1 Tax=Tabrizicola sp. TaxID=2005166 RepID=UPI00286A262A|nr:double-strand break repair helicase AddA [Tabrizicola sp.]